MWWSSVGCILVIPWFVYELPEKDISNVVVRVGSIYNKLTCKISQTWWSSVGSILQ